MEPAETLKREAAPVYLGDGVAGEAGLGVVAEPAAPAAELYGLG